MAQKTLTKPKKTERKKEQEQQVCVHHWIIDPPVGPVSVGTCKLCGAKKEFQNDLSFSGWSNGLSS